MENKTSGSVSKWSSTVIKHGAQEQLHALSLHWYLWDAESISQLSLAAMHINYCMSAFYQPSRCAKSLTFIPKDRTGGVKSSDFPAQEKSLIAHLQW